MESTPSTRFSRCAAMPLLNLMLLLLCVFALWFLWMRRGQLEVAMQRWSCGCGFHGNERALELRVTRLGVSWQGEPSIAIDDLPGRLAHYRAVSMRPSVIVSGTEQAVFGEVVRTLDHLRRAGIEAVAVSSMWTPE